MLARPDRFRAWHPWAFTAADCALGDLQSLVDGAQPPGRRLDRLALPGDLADPARARLRHAALPAGPAGGQRGGTGCGADRPLCRLRAAGPPARAPGLAARAAADHRAHGDARPDGAGPRRRRDAPAPAARSVDPGSDRARQSRPLFAAGDRSIPGQRRHRSACARAGSDRSACSSPTFAASPATPSSSIRQRSPLFSAIFAGW